MPRNKNTKRKICLISSSGGHYEQLKMLNSLSERHDLFWVTERVDYSSKADYYLSQTGSNDWAFVFKMTLNLFKSFYIWIKEKPDLIISTGAIIILPMVLLAKIFRKKVIFIETCARINDASKIGRLMYRHADLFIIQWESLKDVYPNAVYGGCIY